jgi:DNA (cytosine-5)-methyltransferase 1
LFQRQRDGILNKFPIWDDVRTFDGKPWRGKVEVITGGFPCQDISKAGKGEGIAGERSGLWKEFARIIGEVEPQFAFIENSPVLRTRGLGTVLQDLAEMGYSARWCVLGAWHVGANHKRDRMWVLAYPSGYGPRIVRLSLSGQAWQHPQTFQSEIVRQGYREGLPERLDSIRSNLADIGLAYKSRVDFPRGWWKTEPNVGRVDHGVAKRLDRLKATGNGQVPLVAATAFRLLSEGLV